MINVSYLFTALCIYGIVGIPNPLYTVCGQRQRLKGHIFYYYYYYIPLNRTAIAKTSSIILLNESFCIILPF